MVLIVSLVINMINDILATDYINLKTSKEQTPNT